MARIRTRLLMIAVMCLVALVIGGIARVAANGASPMSLLTNDSGPMALQNGLNGANPGDTPEATSSAAQGADSDGASDTASAPENAQDSAQENDQSAAQSNDQAQEQELSGVVGSVDPANAMFTLTTASGTVTVTVTNATEYEDGLSALTSLRSGMQVTVESASSAAGQALATKVKGSDASAADSSDTGAASSGQ